MTCFQLFTSLFDESWSTRISILILVTIHFSKAIISILRERCRSRTFRKSYFVFSLKYCMFLSVSDAALVCCQWKNIMLLRDSCIIYQNYNKFSKSLNAFFQNGFFFLLVGFMRKLVIKLSISNMGWSYVRHSLIWRIIKFIFVTPICLTSVASGNFFVSVGISSL